MLEKSTNLESVIRLVGDFEPGMVSLVGAGPGDSTLISVRGAVRLAQADTVLHDKLVGAELLEMVRPEAETIFVGKWRGHHAWTQEQIHAALVEKAQAGKRVVRLKGGDPFVFGRGGEECEALADAGIPFEVVPGITAAFGAPASAGIPLTHRGLSRSFALVTGHADHTQPDSLDYTALARMETIAIYMGFKNLAANCQCLIHAGMDPQTPAAVIHWGTRPQQKTVTGTLADIAGRVEREQLEPPSLVLIGQVVRLREKIEWFERRPLHGVSVVVTRMPGQAAGLSGPLLAAGAEVIEAPTILLETIPDCPQVDAALGRLPDYDWLVLTSSNGVNSLFQRLDQLGLDSRALAPVRIAAVGEATAASLRQHGIKVDLIPPEAVGESLAEALIQEGIAGKSILLLRAEVAREELPVALRVAGARCDDLPVYRTTRPDALPPSFLERLVAHDIDWLALTSPSSFNHLLELLDEKQKYHLKDVKLASIGPVTSRAVQERGFQVSAEADPHSIAGLVTAIRQAVQQEAGR